MSISLSLSLSLSLSVVGDIEYMLGWLQCFGDKDFYAQASVLLSGLVSSSLFLSLSFSFFLFLFHGCFGDEVLLHPSVSVRFGVK